MSISVTHRAATLWLIVGDLLALLITTMVGFTTHGESIDWHIFTTFIPYTIGWGLIAPWLGVYRLDVSRESRQVWRAALAAFLAAPIAAWLRGFLLGNRPILPIFILALGGSAAVGFGVWRIIWTILLSRNPSHD